MKKILHIVFVMFTIVSLNAQTSAWTPLSSGILTDLYGISTVDANTVYVCGEGGKILKTSNGGVTWSSQTTGTTQDLYSICFVDANIGVAVGTGGIVRRTTDGGANWSSLSVTTDDLRNVSFMLDGMTGYISGGVSGVSGCIFKTTNAGASWAPVPNPSPNGIYSTYFDSPITGYFCNWNGEIYNTTDGGFSWSPTLTGVSTVLYLMTFPSFTTGVAVGLNGQITRTSNSGASWAPVSSGTTNPLCGVSFSDANNGFVVGGNNIANTGTILQTNDAGATWNSYSITSKMLYRIDMFNLNVGYCVGFDGTILKYTSNVGINENYGGNEIIVYPNPASGPVTIEINSLDQNSNMRIEVVDLHGKLILKRNVIKGEKITLDQEQSAGSYIINLMTNDKIIHSKKVIIK